jgi:hypothetical protein
LGDPLTATIVEALAASGAKTLADGGTSALRRLIGVLRDRFRRHPAGRGVLEIALENPDDPEARAALLRLLEEHISNDPDFAQELNALRTDIEAERQPGDQSAHNTVRDVSGNLVQARDINGHIIMGGGGAPRRHTDPY